MDVSFQALRDDARPVYILLCNHRQVLDDRPGIECKCSELGRIEVPESVVVMLQLHLLLLLTMLLVALARSMVHGSHAHSGLWGVRLAMATIRRVKRHIGCSGCTRKTLADLLSACIYGRQRGGVAQADGGLYDIRQRLSGL